MSRAQNRREPESAADERPAREWYAEGLSFECTQCGNCCTGGPGAVWYSDEEAQAMADELGVSLEAFTKTYTRRLFGKRSLREHRTKHGYDCIFLDRTKVPGRAVCGIYRARPLQCRTWPFWPENLVSRDAWEEARRETPCPGMGKGTTVPLRQIRIRLDAQAAIDDPTEEGPD